MSVQPSAEAARVTSGEPRLCLFGGPHIVESGARKDIPEGSKRLVVFVALHGGLVDRRQAAGALWPNGDDERASGNLRSALWRLKGAGIDVLRASKYLLWLHPGTEVDVTSTCEWATRIIDGATVPGDLEIRTQALACADLLPGWYDDWVIFERERLRQRLLHALEELSRQFAQQCRWSRAVEAAMTAVSMEPLRESAQRALVEAHLAEGNLVEARRCVSSYRRLVEEELGVSPSMALVSMVEPRYAAPTAAPRTRGPRVVPRQRQRAGTPGVAWR